jgi:hypothetical protein
LSGTTVTRTANLRVQAADWQLALKPMVGRRHGGEPGRFGNLPPARLIGTPRRRDPSLSQADGGWPLRARRRGPALAFALVGRPSWAAGRPGPVGPEDRAGSSGIRFTTSSNEFANGICRMMAGRDGSSGIRFATSRHGFANGICRCTGNSHDGTGAHCQ